MKKIYIVYAGLLTMSLSVNSYAQNAGKVKPESKTETAVSSVVHEKAARFVASLNLMDTAKAARVMSVLETHMTSVDDWHSGHAYTLIPEGINPVTGKVFNKLERQLIIDSTIPQSVHNDLMTGLRKDLTEDQVAEILDKCTIGKVAFTMYGYKSIIPDLTSTEEAAILTNLQLAREQAVDYKDVKEMSIIFKIYKTKNEDYLNSHGRSWKQLYKSYVGKVLAQKATGKKQN